jgi:hypothetical protein
VIELLDEKDPLLRTAGVHIISFLLNHHTKYVGRYILEPIQAPLLPLEGKVASSVDLISSDDSIEKALLRLEVAIANHSSTFASPLVRPVLLNLFLLAAYTSNTFHSNIRKQVTHLLKSYLKSSSSGATDTLSLIERLVWTSNENGWTYTPGAQGGIAIRCVTSTETADIGFDEITVRIAIIIDIIRETSDDMKSEIFVGIIRHWFSPHEDNPLQYISYL